MKLKALVVSIVVVFVAIVVACTIIPFVVNTLAKNECVRTCEEEGYAFFDRKGYICICVESIKIPIEQEARGRE